MALSPGTRLGPYEVLAPLGAGGMGEVYRAYDTRLDRTVAIKVLPGDLAGDAERRARFAREAKAVASLDHPHICGIFDVGEANGTHYLVMPLVDGQTLAVRLAPGPLPLDLALRIGSEIAEALAAAHRHGIVHRDVKPANVMLTKTGAKLLDFGLAKLHASGGPIAGQAVSGAATTTVDTAAGAILGTVHYMAPEQVEGKDADARSDIWALGAVLYEMIAGERPFAGDTAASVIGAILKDTPRSLVSLQPLSPPLLQQVVTRCLEKHPDARWQSAADVSHLLVALLLDRSAGTAERSRTVRVVNLLPWAIVAILASVLVLSFIRSGPPRAVSNASFVQVESRIADDVAVVTQQGPAAVLSPDGSLLVFVGRKPGQGRQLFSRRLDQLRSTPVPGTDDARIPFFSPDGKWIGFFANGKLKKVPSGGGDVVAVCDAANGRGASWGDDGFIVFNPTTAGSSALSRVSASGGTVQPAFSLDADEATQRWPQVLPGSRAVIYSASSNLGNYNDGEIVARRLPGGERTAVMKGGYFARYLASGHLAYVHDGRLFVVPFDADRLAITGGAVPVLERVSTLVTMGAAQFDASATGTLVYLPAEEWRQPLMWLTREGRIETLPVAPMDWSNLRVSPDGKRIALDVFDGKQTDIHIYDLARGVLDRLTFDAAEDWLPVWASDGARVVFRSTRDSWAFNLFSQHADGGANAARLTESRNPQAPASSVPYGNGLVYSETTPTTDNDVLLLPIDSSTGAASGAATPLLNSSSSDVDAAVSPDGKWLAYASNQDGRYNVYVRPFPGPGPQRQVAVEGFQPVWSRVRAELLYLGVDQHVMVVPYSVQGGAFQAESPRLWASARVIPRPRGLAGFDGRGFDLHPDGNRLLGAFAPADAPLPVQNTVALAFNFFDEVRRLAPPSR